MRLKKNKENRKKKNRTPKIQRLVTKLSVSHRNHRQVISCNKIIVYTFGITFDIRVRKQFSSKNRRIICEKFSTLMPRHVSTELHCVHRYETENLDIERVPYLNDEFFFTVFTICYKREYNCYVFKIN